jgi:transcriptional regulator with XRE-family HTH domain
MKRRNRLVADALVAAAVAMEDLARRAGMSSSALRRYRLGDRTPSSRVLQRLGGTLREQAEQLQKVADQLEEEASRGGIERR